MSARSEAKEKKVMELVQHGTLGCYPNGEIWSSKGGKRKTLTAKPGGGYGYIRHCLMTLDGSKMYVYAHRIVALCLLPNPHGLPEINHINGIKGDNHPENLEWCTRQENQQHACRTGLVDFAEGNRLPHTKLSERQVSEIRMKYATGKITQDALAKEYEVVQASISMIVRGVNWNRTYGSV